jgi:hypothetical protein
VINVDQSADQSAETGHSKYERPGWCDDDDSDVSGVEDEQAFPSAISINKSDSKSVYAKKGQKG